MTTTDDIPRWAKELGRETWQRINELLDAGWKTMDIVRELQIPVKKARSLQSYVRKYGPRRRLIQFAVFKDALLTQIEEFGEQMTVALGQIAALAVSDKTKPAVQVRAVEAMTTFVSVLKGMMSEDAKEAQAADLQSAAGEPRKELSKNAIANLKRIYDLDRDDG